MRKKWTLENIKTSPINRDISPTHVEKLKQVITEFGYIAGCPIIVNSEGFIVDGQHRYEACKQLGVEPPIVECADFASVPYLNSTQLKWGLKDYVNYYASKGFEDYIILAGICKNKGISITIALNCITNKKDVKVRFNDDKKTGYVNPIKNGTFKIHDKSDQGLAKLSRRIDAILNLINLLGLPRTERLVLAICKLAKDPKFSFDIMADKLEYQKARIYRCSTINEYVNMLVNIYNNKSRNKIAV